MSANAQPTLDRSHPGFGTAVAVLAVLAAAGCGGSDGGESAGTGPTTESVDGVGPVLVDADGMTLYTNEAESDGRVRCVGACTDFWPPATGNAPQEIAGVDGAFGDVARPDGGRQLTLDGQPLYTYRDDSPGSAQGDGFEDDFRGDHFVWHAVRASGSEPADDTGGGGGISGY